MLNTKKLSLVNPEQDFILIDKPLGWTSFQVVNKLRYAITQHYKKSNLQIDSSKKRIKVGHAGTLDPLASGLLIICVGKETKNIDQYMATEKEYTGSIFLGATRPSYDRETEIDQHFETSFITNELIHQTAKNFEGEQMQMPPVFSAVKKDGQRAYQAARKGIEIKLEPRPIIIHEFEITEINMSLVHFRIKCSKGTYIRSIAHDFGQKLQSGAYLNQLCRTKSGSYSLQEAISIEEFLAD
jgi:tRNA pseudouridine55 synthase